MAFDSGGVISQMRMALKNYFSMIGGFAFGRAKTYLENERDRAVERNHINYFFSDALSAFALLADEERQYFLFAFLQPTGFFVRENPVVSRFKALLGKLRRLDVSSSRYFGIVQCTYTPPPPLSREDTEKHLRHLAISLSGQIFCYVRNKIKAMEFYEMLYNLSTRRYMDYGLLLREMDGIIQLNLDIKHPFLSKLHKIFNFECLAMRNLLQAQLNIEQWRLTPSLLCIYDVHSKLEYLFSLATKSADSYDICLHEIRSSLKIYNWLNSVKGALAAKFTLYFCDLLSKKLKPTGIQHLSYLASFDYYEMIMNFLREDDRVAFFSFYLDTENLNRESLAELHFSPPLPGNSDANTEQASEKEETLGSRPSDDEEAERAYDIHWPNIQRIMNEKREKIQRSTSVISTFDLGTTSTYLMAQVEPRVTMVVVIKGRLRGRNTPVHHFMKYTCSELRGNKYFAAIKPERQSLCLRFHNFCCATVEVG